MCRWMKYPWLLCAAGLIPALYLASADLKSLDGASPIAGNHRVSVIVLLVCLLVIAVLWLTYERAFPKRWPWPWGSRKYRLDKLVDEVAEPGRKRADEAAASHHSRGHKCKKHPDGVSTSLVYPTLTFTEQNPQWTLLYDHMRRGQIDPDHLRRMRNLDLEYIAAGYFHEDLCKDEKAKLSGNMARATRELQRRLAVRTGMGVVILAALLASQG